MTTCNDEQLRPETPCPPLRSRAHSGRTPAVVPLALSVLLQGAALGSAVALGLPWFVVLAIAVGVAALTAVVRRRTVGSLLAGAGLLVAQPYEPGEQVRVFVPALGSVQDAEIVRVGPVNTTLMTGTGVVVVPNVDMLRGGAPR